MTALNHRLQRRENFLVSQVAGGPEKYQRVGMIFIHDASFLISLSFPDGRRNFQIGQRAGLMVSSSHIQRACQSFWLVSEVGGAGRRARHATLQSGHCQFLTPRRKTGNLFDNRVRLKVKRDHKEVNHASPALTRKR
jgi:hypothetical protein